MEYNRNFFLAIAFSLGIIFAWQYFYAAPANKAQKQSAQIAAQVEAQEKTAAETQPSVSPSYNAASAPQADFSSADVFSKNANAISGKLTALMVEKPNGSVELRPDAVALRAAAVRASPRVAIDTNELEGSVNLRGGMIDDLLLKKYRMTVAKNSPEIPLLNPEGFKESYFFQTGYLSNADVLLPNDKTLWQAEGANQRLTPQTPISLIYDNHGLNAKGMPGGAAHLLFHRVISIDDKFMFTVKDSVENLGGSAVSLRQGARVTRNDAPLEAARASYLLHEGPVAVIGDKGLEEITYKKMAKKEGDDRIITYSPAKGGWIGITDKYWAVALVPAQDKDFTGRFSYDDEGGNTRYQAAFVGDEANLAPHSSLNFENRVFAGAKQVNMLNAYRNGYQNEGDIKQFDLLIDWGLFKIITQPMFKLIDMLYRFVGNFGIAILLVTVILKACLFPLANKSYKSMARMKKLQPAMEQIRKKFADDKVKLQQATMELYRKEKVNPLAGCWPLIIQFPIFFALYKVLYITIEMRQAPFFGWIQDLSAPDPTSLFNLFGLLPFDVPQMLMIGAWPVIMGITMFLQMRMNPTPPDPTQAMIFTYMPIVFTWMLAAFPAGLVIYWAWNNTLSIIQQGIIMKRQGVPIELFNNLKTIGRKKPKLLEVAGGNAPARTDGSDTAGDIMGRKKMKRKHRKH